MAGPRILVIDDDINILSTLRILFQREGFQVQTAFDGEDGLKKIIAGSVDIILSDVDMPKVSGFEVFQKLKVQGLVQQVPIIMMSGGVNPVDRAKYIEEGAEDFISKPFNTIELLARVRRILSRVAGHLGAPLGAGAERDSTAAARPTELTRGKLGEILVPDLVQFFLLGQKDGFLELTRPTATARLFFVGGQIIHCTVIEKSGIAREGDDAVYHMMGWTEGSFRAAFERVAIPRRIKTPTHELLLEHARRADDHRRHAEEVAAVVAPSAHPPVPAVEPAPPPPRPSPGLVLGPPRPDKPAPPPSSPPQHGPRDDFDF